MNKKQYDMGEVPISTVDFDKLRKDISDRTVKLIEAISRANKACSDLLEDAVNVLTYRGYTESSFESVKRFSTEFRYCSDKASVELRNYFAYIESSLIANGIKANELRDRSKHQDEIDAEQKRNLVTFTKTQASV